MLEEVRQLAGPTDRELLQLIQVLPVTVEQAYDKILRKSPRPDMARTILSLVAIAAKPLDIKELEVLLKVDNKSRRLSDIDLSGSAHFKNAARHACGLFLTIIDSKVYLIHQTAKEFLLNKSKDPLSMPLEGCIDSICAHSDMAARCMLVLCLGLSEWPTCFPFKDDRYGLCVQQMAHPFTALPLRARRLAPLLPTKQRSLTPQKMV